MTGTGTLEDPYVILTRADLEAVDDNMSANYALGADISLSGADWIPLGGIVANGWSAEEFTGSFDGRGHAISDMTIHADEAWSEGGSLFGWVSGGVKNVNICNANIYLSGAFSMDGVGILCTRSGDARLENCYVSGTIHLDFSSDGYATAVGGLVGYTWGDGSFSRCGADLKIITTGTTASGGAANVGGFLGYNTGLTTTSVVDVITTLEAETDANGDVDVLWYAGGIVGLAQGNITISNCRATVNLRGDVDGAGYPSRFGGLVGELRLNANLGVQTASICDSDASGALSCQQAGGGIIGEINLMPSVGEAVNTLTIARCSTNVDVHVGKYGGGLCGYRESEEGTAYFTDCYALGLVHCHEPYDSPSDCIGGFIGADLAGSIYTNCYAAGEVIGEAGGTDIGGFAGKVWA